jgi:hypothetical protein
LRWLRRLWENSGIASIPQRISAWYSRKARFVGRKPKLVKFVCVDDFPERLKASRLYLAGETGHFWGAAMICPCGCGETIQLNLLKEARPCWSVQEHEDGSITVLPSVWRQKGCRSHFFVRRSRIEWC